MSAQSAGFGTIPAPVGLTAARKSHAIPLTTSIKGTDFYKIMSSAAVVQALGDENFNIDNAFDNLSWHSANQGEALANGIAMHGNHPSIIDFIKETFDQWATEPAFKAGDYKTYAERVQGLSDFIKLGGVDEFTNTQFGETRLVENSSDLVALGGTVRLPNGTSVASAGWEIRLGDIDFDNFKNKTESAFLSELRRLGIDTSDPNATFKFSQVSRDAQNDLIRDNNVRALNFYEQAAVDPQSSPAAIELNERVTVMRDLGNGSLWNVGLSKGQAEFVDGLIGYIKADGKTILGSGPNVADVNAEFAKYANSIDSNLANSVDVEKNKALGVDFLRYQESLSGSGIVNRIAYLAFKRIAIRLIPGANIVFTVFDALVIAQAIAQIIHDGAADDLYNLIKSAAASGSFDVKMDPTAQGASRSLSVNTNTGDISLKVGGNSVLDIPSGQWLSGGVPAPQNAFNLPSAGAPGNSNNGTTTDLDAQLAAINAEIDNASLATNGSAPGWSLPPGTTTIHETITFGALSFTGTAYFDGDGRWIGFTPDQGQSGSVKMFDGTVVPMDGSRTILVGPSSSSGDGTGISAYGWTTQDSNLVASSLRFQTIVQDGAQTNYMTSYSAAQQDAIRQTVDQDFGETPPSNASIDNSRLTVFVPGFGTLAIGQPGYAADPSAFVNGGYVWSLGGTAIISSSANEAGLAPTSSNAIVTGGYQPGLQDMLPNSSNFSLLTQNLNAGSVDWSKAVNVTTDNAALASAFTDVDPLLIDIAGGGIGVTNWIDNSVYFDTAINPATGAPDGLQHHTSWVASGTGILVFDPNDGPITNITQTISQFFAGGATPGHYADGLAALASLIKIDPSTGQPYIEFSAATAAIDPATGQSYWNEVKVWNDANQNGVVDAGEIVSLSSLGIASIDLLGSGNLGESLNGSAVTNRTTYTRNDGTNGAVASVDFQANSAGDVTTSATGGLLVSSVGEGGITQATSYVVQNTAAHVFTLSGGVLTDATLGQTVGTGVTGVLSTGQNDIISVAANDTGSYWLGGGNGADTLTGGAGTNVFLVNPKTVVHGGSGFNIAKVTGTQGVTIDMLTENLQEVVGGKGGDVINASGTTWNVFIQAGNGNSIIIGGAAAAAISGGKGDDLIELGSGGGVVHAGSGNDLIYGGSGTTSGKPNSDVIFAGAGHDTVVLGTNNSEVYAGTGALTVIGNAAGYSVLGLHGSYADYTLTRNADGTMTITNINNMDGDGTVTMQNVTALDFKDVSKIPIATALAMPVNDYLSVADQTKVQTTASGQYVVAASTLLANDIDYAGNALSIRALLDSNGNLIARGASGQVNGGVVTLSSDGSAITFTPTAGFNGVDSFRYVVVDGYGNEGVVINQVGTTTTAEMNATVYLNTPDQPTDSLFDSEWFLQAADVLPVWKDYTGAGVSVGVFDLSGNVDFSNPDLAPNAGAVVKVDGTPGIELIGNHATLVAGVIAAARDGEGAVGVAYDATISSEALRSGDSTGATNLRDWRNYDVVNNSWGGLANLNGLFQDNYLYNVAVAQDVLNAASYGRNGLGTAIVFAAGNSRAAGDNTNNHNESNSPYTIVVGGINAQSAVGSLIDALTPFSDPGASILVSAPASNVTSTGVQTTNQYGQTFGADVQTTQGTSLAAPMVSGVVALMLQANPKLGYRDIQQILAYSAVKVDPTNPTWSVNGSLNWNGGGLHVSQDYGYGEVDARAAVRLAETWTSQDTVANLRQVTFAGGVISGSPSSAVSLNYAIPVDTGTSTPALSLVFPSASASQIRVEHVDVELNLIGVRATDLIIKLIAPSGEVSVLANRPDNTTGQQGTDAPQNVDFTFDTVDDWGELSGGTWKLEVAYAAGTTPVGTLAGVRATISGSPASGAQTFVFTDEYAGGATITPVTANDVFNAAAATGNDIIDLRAGSTDSVIDGKAATVAGNLGAAFGGDGNDTLIGNGSGDTLDGGRGNDTMIGNGYDTYVFDAHGGQDVIVNGLASNAGPTGELIMGQGLAPENYWITRSGNNLLIQILGTKQRVTINSWYTSPSSELQAMYLGDNVKATTAEINQLASVMTAYSVSHPDFNPETATRMPIDPTVQNVIGNDWSATLVGTPGNDTLDAGPTNATLIGNGGNDTYVFNTGYRTDVIYDGLPLAPNDPGNSLTAGRLLLGAGLEPNSLWFSWSGDDLVMRVLGTSSQVIFKNWSRSYAADVQYLTLHDGSSIGTLAIGALADAMTAYMATSPGFDPTAASAMPSDVSLLSALNSHWSRVITSSGDSASLNGVYGNDTIIAQGAGNTLSGGAGASTLISNAGGNTLEAGGGPAVALYVGQDMTVDLKAGTAGFRGASAHDTLIGIHDVVVLGDDNTLVASSGADTLTAIGDGNTLVGGSGIDTLAVTGSNPLVGGGGNTLIGGPGTATLVSNPNDNMLVGGTGSTTAWYAGDLIAVDLPKGVASTRTLVSDILLGIRAAAVSGFWDTITSSRDGDTMVAAGNDDTLAASGNAAVLIVQGAVWTTGGNTLSASGSHDTLIASTNRDVLIEAGSNDTLLASGVGDTLIAAGTAALLTASGVDGTLIARAGGETLIASGASETLLGDLLGNTLLASSNSDLLVYAASAATVDLSHGLATTNGVSLGDTLIGIANVAVAGNNDTLVGGSGTTLVASGSSDTLLVSGSNATLSSSGTNDTLQATGNADTLMSAGDFDTLIAIGTGSTLSASGVHATIDAIGSGNTLLGGAFLETLIGHASGNTLVGGTGRTTAFYGGGNVTVNLPTGTARVNGGGVADSLVGLTRVTVAGNNDTLIGTTGFNTLMALGSNDTVIAGYGVDTLIAASHDTLIGANGSATLVATGAANALYGGGGTSTLIGLSGGNLLLGGSGLSTLMGGAIGNTLVAGTGQTVAAYSNASVTVNLSAGTASINGGSVSDTLVGITVATVAGTNDTVIASHGENVLIATGASDTLIAIGDDDAMIALGSNDTVSGSGQHDTLLAQGDDETIISAGAHNTIVAWGNNDTLIALGDLSTLVAFGTHDILIGLGRQNLLEDLGRKTTLVSNGADNTLESGAGPTVVSYTGNGLMIDLSGGSAKASGATTGDTLLGIVAASVTGNDNTLIGGSGDDTLAVTGSANTLIGGVGTTTLISSLGGNTLLAGAGLAVAAYAADGAIADLSAGVAQANGGTVNDTLVGIRVAEAFGNNDTLLGGVAGGDTLIAAGGTNDTLVARGTSEVLQGGSGSATLVGNGAGNTLIGGAGQTVAYFGLDNLVVNLATGTARVNGASTADTLVGITRVVLSGANDTVIGDSGTDTLFATGSGDMLMAGSGTTTMVSNGAGNTLLGGAGTTADYADKGVAVDLAAGTARISGSGEFDTLIGISVAQATGSFATLIGANSSNSTLIGNTAGNTLVAGTGSYRTVAMYDADHMTADLASGTVTGQGTGLSDMLVGTFDLQVFGSNDILLAGPTSANLQAFGDGNTLINAFNNGTLQAIGTHNFLYASGSTTLVANVDGNTLSGGSTKILIGNHLVVTPGTVTAPDGQSDQLIGGGIVEVGGDNNTLISSSYYSNSVLSAGTGDNNTLIAQYGSGQTLLAGSGQDATLIASANTYADVLEGGSGTSTLVGTLGLYGNTLIGGSGAAAASYGANGIVVDLTAGHAGYTYGVYFPGTSILVSIGWFEGADTLVGISVAQATGSNETLIGGTAASTLMSNGDGNTLLAGRGPTEAYYSADNMVVDLTADTGSEYRYTSGYPHDTLVGINIVKADGSNDTLIAAPFASRDTLVGGHGITTLVSAPSKNTLVAGAGPTVASYGSFGDGSSAGAYYFSFDAQGVVVDLGAGTAEGGTLSLNGFQYSTGVDTLVGITIAQATSTGETLIGGSAFSTLMSNGEGNVLIAGSGGAIAYYDDRSPGIEVDLPMQGDPLPGWAGSRYTLAADELDGSIQGAQVAGSGDTIYCGDVGQLAVSSGSYNSLYGFGSDTLISSGSHDSLFGGGGFNGAGSDTLISTGSNDSLFGSGSGDTLVSTGSHDRLVGGGGGHGASDDTLISTGIGNTLIGGAGDKLISFGSESTLLSLGHSTLISSGSGDALYAATGDRVVSSGADDLLYSAPAGNTLTSTNGAAVAVYSGSGIMIDLDAGTARDQSGNVDTLVGVHKLDIAGTHETLIGRRADMTLTAPGGNTLIGSAGATKVSYVNGNTANFDFVLDLATGEMVAGGASDTLIGITRAEVNAAYYGTLIGGDSVDELSSVGNYNTMIAGSGAEFLSSEGQGNTVIGGSGAGTLMATGSGNTLVGGSGVNTLMSSGGNTLIAGRGRTIGAIFGTGEAVDLVVGAPQPIGLSDTLVGISVVMATGTLETLIGGSGADTLLSTGAGNTLVGEAGSEALSSSGSCDTLVDAADTDTLVSTGRSNKLIAGAGADTLVSSGVGDTLVSVNGQNLLASKGRNNTLLAGMYADRLLSSGFGDTLIAGTGAGTLMSNGEGNILLAAGSASTLWSSGTNDTLVGDAKGVLLESAGGQATVALYSRLSYDLDHLVVDLGTGVARVNGAGAADTLVGISAVKTLGWGDTIIGGAGGDTLESTAGWSTIIAGSGADTLLSDGQSDTLIGGAGHDTILSMGEFNKLLAGSNDDVLLSGGLWDTLIGGAVADTLVSTSTGRNNQLFAGSGTSTLWSSGYGDTLVGGGGINMLVTRGTADWLIAGGGPSLLVVDGNGGHSTLQGGAGSSTLIAEGNSQGNTLIGGAGTPLLEALGNSTRNMLIASRSNATLYSAGSANWLTAQASNDTLVSSGANDILTGNGTGATLLSAGGTGTVAFCTVDNAVINLGTATARVNGAGTADSLIGIEAAGASGVHDTLIAGSGRNLLEAFGVGDTLIGGTGDNVLLSGIYGDNTLIAGSGSQTLLSYTGNDLLIAGSGADILDCEGGSSTAIGGSGADTLMSGVEYQGYVGRQDTLFAGSGYDVFQIGDDGFRDTTTTIINGSASNAVAHNELDFVDGNFHSGITDEQLWLSRANNDLVIDILGQHGSVTVSNWFAGTGYQMQEITVGGLKLDSQIAQLVQAMATYSAANLFNPTASTITQLPNDPALQSAIASAWHH
jgi:Ca2+-binding RTX toxin-like protein/subtilisin-like proprotein convertase family protein